MTYLNVGTDFIYPELTIPVKNGDNFKPVGGFWATPQSDDLTYNPWLDFLCDHPEILFFKEKNDIYNQKGVLFTLKDSTNIFNLQNKEQLEFLFHNYYNQSGIDYEKLAQKYDGFFINIYSLIKELHDPNLIELILKFGVTSLCLFNIFAIDHYTPTNIFIDPFSKGTNYSIISTDVLHQLENPQKSILDIIKRIIEFIKSKNITMNKDGYNIIKETFANEITKVIQILNDRHQIDNNKVERLLILKSFQSI